MGEKLVARLCAINTAQIIGTYFTRSVEVPGCSLIPVDLRDSKAVNRLYRDLKPALTIHCAGITDSGFCEREPESAYAGIVVIAENLISARNSYTPEAPIISLSTDMVFNGAQGNYDESAQANPISVYGRCKLQADEFFLAETNTTIIRPALIYGEPSTHHGSFLGWMIQALAEGKPLQLFADEQRTPLYVHDLIDLILSVASTPHSEKLYHAGGSTSLSRVQMGETLCRVFGFSDELLESKNLKQAGLDKLRPADVSLNSALAQQTFRFHPKSFDAGIRLIEQNL